MRIAHVLLLLASTYVLAQTAEPAAVHHASVATDHPTGKLEIVHEFYGPMPTGVTVSHTGRIFVNFPRWGDKVDYSVAEIVNGKTVPYPNADINKPEGKKLQDALISVQSVVVDPQGRLWILDTGSPMFQPVQPGGAKLIGVDLSTNQVFKKIVFRPDVALPTSYFNDVRFDLHRGNAGMAYITDSSTNGSNAIIVVDLYSGKAWRRLNEHPSVKADPLFQGFVEGQPMLLHKLGQNPQKQAFGVDGIAISPDGQLLYYCPLASRHLFSVSVDALSELDVTEDQAQGEIRDLAEKGASDGMETDQEGRVYFGDYENDSIRRYNPADGTFETLAHDPRILWPDTLSLTDGYLYFTANQLERQPNYHDGKDLRQKPYILFRIKIDGHRIKP